jgi:hypothetical protein
VLAAVAANADHVSHGLELRTLATPKSYGAVQHRQAVADVRLGRAVSDRLSNGYGEFNKVDRSLEVGTRRTDRRQLARR